MKGHTVEIFVRNISGEPFFKTNDVIQGEVFFTPHHATRLENVNISFQGMYYTRLLEK